MRPWGLVVLSCLCALGCREDRQQVDKPTPPDMSAVVTAYSNPTGTFDQTTAKAALDAYDTAAQRVRALGFDTSILTPLAQGLDEALAQSSTQSAPGTSQQALDLEANGTLSVKRICNGWQTDPVPDPKNGTLGLRVNFSETGLDPVIWGSATDCHYLVGGLAKVIIDQGSGRRGDVRLWVGHSATFQSFGDDPVLLDLDLSIEVDGVAEDFSTSFSWDPLTAGIAMAIDTASGGVVVSRGTTGPLSVLAQNGHFECQLATSQCTSDDGQSFAF